MASSPEFMLANSKYSEIVELSSQSSPPLYKSYSDVSQPSPASSSDAATVYSSFETPIRTSGLKRETDQTPGSSLASPLADCLASDDPFHSQKDQQSNPKQPKLIHSDSSPAALEGLGVGIQAIPSTSINAEETEELASHTHTHSQTEPLITVRNAQNVYLPEACIFVANLPKHKSDYDIERILRSRFGTYGLVFIKVRRDRTRLPIAFCQYTTINDAEKALAGGEEIRVFGRPCRVEKARCRRALYVTKTDHTFDMTRDAPRVQSLLESHGRGVERAWPATSADMTTYGLAPGMWVQFKLYGDCQDVLKDLRNCAEYRFELIRDQGQRVTRTRPYFPIPDREMSNYGSAVLVKNLPSTFEVSQVCHMFSSFGSVVGAQIVTSSSTDSKSAVVHFFGALDAANAVAFATHYGIAAQDVCTGTWSALEVTLMWQTHPLSRRSLHYRPWSMPAMHYSHAPYIEGMTELQTVPAIDPYWSRPQMF